MLGCAVVLGISLLCINHLGLKKYWQPNGLISTLFHEAGMALLVSALIGGAIDATIHVDAARRTAQHEEEMAMIQSVAARTTAQHEEEMRKIHSMKDEVVDLFKRLQPREGELTAKEHNDLIESIKKMRPKLEKSEAKQTLDEWESVARDNYGSLLLKLRDPKRALQQFEKAEGIDKLYKHTKVKSRYYPYTLTRLTVTYLHLGDRNKAIKTQEKAVEAMSEIKERYAAMNWDFSPHVPRHNYYQRLLHAVKNSAIRFQNEILDVEVELTNESSDEDLAEFGGKSPHKAAYYVVEVKKGRKYDCWLKTDDSKLDPFLIVFRTPSDYMHNDDEDARNKKYDSHLKMGCLEDDFFIVCATTSPQPAQGRKKTVGKLHLRIHEQSER
jgi:tetratricopeptide (TPR) repeat protein